MILVCAGLVFIGFKANQPMAVPGAPGGMTYVEFIKGRINAAKTVEPSRCGWGMMLSLATLGPIYRVVYTADQKNYALTAENERLQKIIRQQNQVLRNLQDRLDNVNNSGQQFC